MPPSDLRGRVGVADAAAADQAAAFARAGASPRPTSPTSRRGLARRRAGAACAGAKRRPRSCRRAREGTVIFPGFDGGAEWGGAAFDDASGLLYVNANEMPWILLMVPIDGAKETHATSRAAAGTYQINCVGVPRHRPQGRRGADGPVARDTRLASMPRADAEKIIAGGKAVMPAFPSLAAGERKELLSLSLRRQAERRSSQRGRADSRRCAVHPHRLQPLPRSRQGYPGGEAAVGHAERHRPQQGRDRVAGAARRMARSSPAAGPAPTGTENYGGPVVTAGGVIFIGATHDEKFRAFDKRTGKLLWETVAARRRLRDAEHLRRQRQAVRRDCRRRRQDGHEVGRRVRRVRAARLSVTASDPGGPRAGRGDPHGDRG